MKSLYCLQYFIGVFIWLDLVPDFAHDAIFIDQEGLPVDAHELLAIHVFLFPHSIELGNGGIRIGKQRERETVLVRKFLVGLDAISADTQYDNTTFLHLVIGITKAASLFRTAWRIVLWIEIENDGSPFEVSQVDLAVLHHIIASHCRKSKIRS